MMATGLESTPSPPARLTRSPLALLASAAGGPRQWADKLRRLAATARLYVDGREVRERLERLKGRGYIARIPTRAQLAVGGLDMVRYVISPFAADYYRTKGINFTFHQVLRFLDDPVSVIDPVGILSQRDTIIGHLMQVTHLNPIYDLQLLEMFEDGLDALELQLEQMLAGTHPRAGTIGAIVEDPDYHARLLAYLRAWRADRATPPIPREDGGLRSDPYARLAELSFAELPSFMRYANRLPQRTTALLRHLARDRRIDPAHCDPEAVAGAGL